MELIISLSILIIGWSIVNYWQKKADREKEKKPNYPSATRRLDDFEEKIS